MTGTLAVLIVALALLLAAAAIVLMRGSTAGRMRERVRAAGALDATTVLAADQKIRVMAPDERRPLQRLAAVLGYNPELPPAYAASPLFVIAAAGLTGAASYWRLELLFGGFAGAAAALPVAALTARFLLRRKTVQYAALLFHQIPEVMSLVLRAVRAGLPVAEALRSVGGREMPSPTREEFSRVSGEAALGVPLETAMSHLYARTQIREYAFFAVTLGLNRQTGGNLAETLDILADTVRRRVAMAGKARALAAAARASAAVLAALPFVVGLVITAINPGYMNEIFTDPRGSNLILAFVVLLACGLLTMRWIINRSSQD
jgi:tight adherence protein B